MNAVQTAFTLFATVGLGLSCVGEVGLQGPTGPIGPMGVAGMNGQDGQSIAANASCPSGYTQDSNLSNIVLCKRGNDEVVKVGVALHVNPDSHPLSRL